MKITSGNFIRLSLFFPYMFAALLFGCSFIIDPTMNSASDFSGFHLITGIISTIIALTSIIYLLGGIYWLVPYTILVVFLWIWSKKKTFDQIKKLLMLSPLLLAILISVFSTVMSLFSESLQIYSSESLEGVIILAFLFSLFFGYVFICAAIWLFGFLKSRQVIVE